MIISIAANFWGHPVYRAKGRPTSRPGRRGVIARTHRCSIRRCTGSDTQATDRSQTATSGRKRGGVRSIRFLAKENRIGIENMGCCHSGRNSGTPATHQALAGGVGGGRDNGSGDVQYATTGNRSVSPTAASLCLSGNRRNDVVAGVTGGDPDDISHCRLTPSDEVETAACQNFTLRSSGWLT